MATFLHKIFGNPDDDPAEHRVDSVADGDAPPYGDFDGPDHDDNDEPAHDDDDGRDHESDKPPVGVILPPTGETPGRGPDSVHVHAVDVVGRHEVQHFGLPETVTTHNHFTGIALQAFLGKVKKNNISDKELTKIVAASLRVGDAMTRAYFE